MRTVNRIVTPVLLTGQFPLPIDTKRYLREITFVAAQAATSHDERITRLSLKLLALQAPRLKSLASRGVLSAPPNF